MERRALVLDANIRIRAVLGGSTYSRSSCGRPIFLHYRDRMCGSGRALAAKHGGDLTKALAFLRSIAALGTLIGLDLYSDFETESRKRLKARDPEDWPILAAALALGCPIWTEDTDFFGCGVATWTSTSIDSFLTQ
jgi:hypothetical protein